MSTKTTFKRIALVAVAALGFGVLSVVPSQATVSGLSVTVEKDSTATLTIQDTSTAGTILISALHDALAADTITVSIIQKTVPSTSASSKVLLGYQETTTQATRVDNATVFAGQSAQFESITAGGVFSISSASAAYVGARFTVQLESSTADTLVAGTYTYTVVAKPYTAGVEGVAVSKDINIVIAAAAAAAAPVASAATAYLQQGTLADTGFTGVLADSVTSGILTAATQAGTIQVRNQSAAGVYAKDTITVTMTGVGYLTYASVTGRSFVIANVESATINVLADGASGVGTVTLTTAAGASFVKTVSFWDTKPSKVVATVNKAFIKAGTGSVSDVLRLVVSDTAGNPITSGLTLSVAPTDTATTVGGASTCGAYDTTDKAYICAVAGLSATKFGPVAYTIKATGADAAKTVVSTTATVTFADNVATKAVLAGPASAAPGASVDYTITLTEKNGYPVADMVYGAGGSTLAPGGVLFATRVAAGWGATTPFATTESFTAKSGVITSKGTMPLAGTVTGTWTLAGDGLQTLATDAIDKTIGKTTVTASTEVANAAADAATQAAEEAAAAAQDATDAALDATTAAEAAGALAQEAVDAVAELSAQVTTLIAALKDQITKLTNLVVKIQKKVKA